MQQILNKLAQIGKPCVNSKLQQADKMDDTCIFIPLGALLLFLVHI